MNILVNKLPTKIAINDKEYSINYGFKAFVLIEMCFTDDDISASQKQADALDIFYKGNIPEDVVTAMEKLLWFYRCGKEGASEQQKSKAEMSHTVRAYDFDKDQFLIYAAFKQQYGINLNAIKSDELHWWEFRALFEGLSDNCTISRVMGFRTMSLKGMKGKQLQYYKRMKELYALKDTKTVESKIALAERNEKMKAYVRRRIEENKNV